MPSSKQLVGRKPLTTVGTRIRQVDNTELSEGLDALVKQHRQMLTNLSKPFRQGITTT